MIRDTKKTLKLDHVFVGKVSKPHGVRGEIKVWPFSGCPENFRHYTMLVLVNKGGEVQRCSVDHARTHNRHAIVALSGMTMRAEAEAIQGCEVWVPKADLPVPGPDEFLWHEVIGLRVHTDDGRDLGVVKEIMATGAHDVLVITGQGQEYLVPTHREFIEKIDMENGLLVIRPLPGLLEMNAERTRSDAL